MLKREKEGPTSFLIKGEGPVLLLLHGIPGAARSWERAGAVLADHFQVVIPDMLGFGDSDLPTGEYYLAAQAEALARFLTARGITELYLGGHDIGAPLALTLMRDYPQFKVRGLVVAAANLLGNVKITPLLKITQTRFLNGLIVWLMIGNRLAHRMLYRVAVVNKVSYPWSDYVQHLTSSGTKYTRLLYQRTMTQFRETYLPIEEFLPEVNVSTLLVWGAGDPILKPSLGKKLQRIISGSVLKIYDETGHYLPEEQPERLASDIIEHLAPSKGDQARD